MIRARRVEDLVRSARFHLDHLFTQRRLSAYLDGELAAVERSRIARHIAECPDCDGAARSLYRMITGLALLRRGHPSRLAPDVIERLRSQTRRDRAAPRR